MATQIFEVDAEWEGAYGQEISWSGRIELDQRILDNVDDSFRQQLYDLATPQEVAEHIAYNIIVNHAKVWELDGWANMPHDVIVRIL